MDEGDFQAGHLTNVGSRTTPLAVALFALIAALIGLDIAADYGAGTEGRHLLAEGIVMALALAGVGALWSGLRSTSRHAEQLTVDLAAARRQAEQFRQDAHDALRGLGEAIDRQFGRWGLTPAEREIGLLLLKGLTHKEVANARTTSEATIRQQALAIYRKAGLRNRSELSAFFLEDLLMPVGQR